MAGYENQDCQEIFQYKKQWKNRKDNRPINDKTIIFQIFFASFAGNILTKINEPVAFHYQKYGYISATDVAEKLEHPLRQHTEISQEGTVHTRFL